MKKLFNTIDIKYHQYDIIEGIKQTPLSLDCVGFEPEPVFKNFDKDAIYYPCPAWQHKAKRTFIVRSPVDITLKVTPPTDGSREASIESENLNQLRFDRWVTPTFDSEGWCRKERVTLQLNIPKILFWTKSKNVWVEQKPYSLTAVNNNLIAVSGWFNVSSWTRPLSFAFDVVDTSKPIIIRRGDPMYEVCFHSSNQNDFFKLTKEEPSDPLINLIMKNTFAKSYVSRSMEKEMFKNQSKCPFEFLWKK